MSGQGDATTTVPNDDEARALGALIIGRLDGDDAGLPTKGVRDEFVKFRFQEALLKYDKRSIRHGRFNGLFKASVVGLGALISGAAASTWFREQTAGQVLLAAAVAVAVIAAVDQILKPAVRNANYGQCRTTLRKEGWDFVNCRGRYQSGATADRYQRFVDEVLKVQERGRAGLYSDERAKAE
jgi:hypothetical protein